MKGKNVKFSIIVPAHNTKNSIEKTINSVLNQNFINYELIIVDDMSTDNSKEIYRKYKKNKNIRVIYHRKNKKAGGARNTGIKASRGAYIIFLDADDYLKEENVLSKINEIIGNDTPDIIYTGFEGVGKEIEGQYIPTKENSVKEKRLTQWKYENVWDICWNKEFINKNKLKFIENRYFEDFMFYYRGVILSNTYKVAQFVTHVYNSGRTGSMTTELTIEKIEDLYFNTTEMFKFIKNIPTQYHKYMLEAAYRNNNYINSLIEKLK